MHGVSKLYAELVGQGGKPATTILCILRSVRKFRKTQYVAHSSSNEAVIIFEVSASAIAVPSRSSFSSTLPYCAE